MSLIPYKNYAKVLRDSEAGKLPLKTQLAMVNSRSWKKDPGGWSYGMYQLATFGHKLAPGPRIVGPKTDQELFSSKSPFHGFLEWGSNLGSDLSLKFTEVLNPQKLSINSLALQAAGVSAGTYIDNTAFIKSWVDLANKYPEVSEELQSGYHARQYYWPAHALLKKKGIDLLNRSEAVNQLITDYTNVGPGHFANAVKSLSNLSDSMTDKELIMAFSDYYAELFDKFGKAQPVFAKGWANRFGTKAGNKIGHVAETCLKML